MSSVAQAVVLTGSIAMVTEYFGFAMNAILYQRGVYPSDHFQLVHKYDLPLYITTNESLSSYTAVLLQQIVHWISSRECSRLVLLLQSAETEEVLERWEFVLDTDDNNDKKGRLGVDNAPRVMYQLPPPRTTNKKTEEEVKKDIQAVMRQITSCVSFLPTLEGPLVFDVLVYTTVNTTAPADGNWELSDPRLLEKGYAFHLKSFDTTHHKVATSVSYKES